ncbi:MAG: tetratricopeptide repeat protein [Terracidiphilus sp.]
MRHLLAVATLVGSFVFHCLPSAAESADRAASYLADCKAKAAGMLWKEAMTGCEKAIRAKPDYAEAYYELGHATTWYGATLDKPDKRKAAYDDAIEDFTKAIALKPDYAEAYVGRGYLLRQNGNTAGTIADFTRALEITGSGWCNCQQAKWKVLADRADLRGADGDLDGALADYGAAIEASHEKEASSLHIKRAELEKAKGNPSGAIADLTSAIQLSSDTEAYRARAAIKHEKGDLDGAIADLTSALLVDPCSSAAYGDRAPIRKAKGDTPGAQSDEAAAKQFSASAGTSCEQSMSFVAGVSGFDVLIEVSDAHGSGLYPKDSPTAKDFLAQKETELGANAQQDIKSKNWDAAVFDLTKAIKLGMDDPRLFMNRGTMRRFRGDADGANADFTRAIQISEESASTLNDVPTAAVAHFVRGEAESADFGDAEKAIADFDKALQLAPNASAFQADVYLGRAAAKQRKEDLDGAIEDCTKAIELTPGNANAYSLRALDKQAKGDIRGAEADQADAARLKAASASQK